MPVPTSKHQSWQPCPHCVGSRSSPNRGVRNGLGLTVEFLDHLTVVGSRAERLTVELDSSRRLRIQSLTKFVDADLWPFRHVDHVQNEMRRTIIRTRLPEQIEYVLGVPQVRKIGGRGDDNLVSLQSTMRFDHDVRPSVRHDQRRRKARSGARYVDDHFARRPADTS